MSINKLPEYVLFLILLLGSASSYANDLIVTYKNDICIAKILNAEYQCSIGKNGITIDKREGDGKTPIGKFPLRQVFVRADKITKNSLKHIKLPIQELQTYDGWCDDPKNKQYNKYVDLRNFDLSISHEKLYRTDDLYDIIVVVGYNDNPVIPNKGSAIFIHVAANNYTGTAGCVGFSESDLLKILPKLEPDSNLIIQN